jgi:hypothetical protein
MNSDRCVPQPPFANSAPDRCILKGHTMAKGKNSNKETKKPKQEKPKVLATANSLAGKPGLEIAGKKVK